MEKLCGSAPASVVGRLRSGDGSVSAATSGGVYLELNGRIMLICPERWGVVPIGAAVENYGALAALRPEAGQRAMLREGRLTLPGGSVQLLLKEAEEGGFPGLPTMETLLCAADTLAERPNARGLAPLAGPLLLNRRTDADNAYCRAALPVLRALSEGIAAGSTERISHAAGRLIGLGPGLTPSGDDVLCGMLYVLVRSGGRSADALAEAVRRLAPEATGRISAEYLTALSNGAPYGRMEEAWAALASGRTEGTGRLTEVGSSSGTEMLLGMLLAGMLLHGAVP